MAVRYINAINNAVETIKDNETLAVELIQRQFNHYRDMILSRSNDIVDVIDTYKYCVEKGLSKELSKFSDTRTCGVIRIQNRNGKYILAMTHKDESSMKSTQPLWCVETDGKEVYISVNDSMSNVPSMVDNAYYNKSNECVVAPIFLIERQHYVLNAEKPLSAIKEFASILPTYADNFFTALEHLGSSNKGEK